MSDSPTHDPPEGGEQPAEAVPPAPASVGTKGPPQRPQRPPRPRASSGTSPDSKRNSMQSLRDQVGNKSGQNLMGASDAFRKSKLFSALPRPRGGTLVPEAGDPYLTIAGIKFDLRGMTHDQADGLRCVDAKVLELSNEMQRMAEAYNKKAAEYTDVVDILKDKENLIVQLRSGEADDVRNFKDDAMEKVYELREQITDLTERNEQLQEEGAQLKDSCAKALKEAEEAKEDLENYRERTRSTLEEQQRQVDVAVQKEAEARDELQAQKEENSALQGSLTGLQLVRDELELELKRVKKDLGRVREELETLKNQQQGMVVEINEFQMMHDTDINKIDELEKKLHDQRSNVQSDLDGVADELRIQAGKLLLANEELISAVDGENLTDEEASQRAAELEALIPDADLTTEVDRTALLSDAVTDAMQRLRDDIARLDGEGEMMATALEEADERMPVYNDEADAFASLLGKAVCDRAALVAQQQETASLAVQEQRGVELSEESERQEWATLAYAELLQHSAREEAKARQTTLDNNAGFLDSIEMLEEQARAAIEEQAAAMHDLLQDLQDASGDSIERDILIHSLQRNSLEDVVDAEAVRRVAIEDEEEDARKHLQETEGVMQNLINAQDVALQAAADAVQHALAMAISDVEGREEELRKQIGSEEELMRDALADMQEAGRCAALQGQQLSRQDDLLTGLCARSLEEAEVDEAAARQIIEEEEEDARKMLRLAHTAVKDVIQECQEKEDDLVAASDVLRASNDRAVSDLEEYEEEQRKQIEEEEEELLQMLQQMDDVGELLARHDEMLTEVCAKSLEEAEVDETAGRQIIEEEEEDARKLLHLAHSALKDTIQECQEKEDELAAKEDELACASDALRASNDRAVSDLEEQEQDQRKQIEEEEEELLQMLQQMDDVGELLARHDEMLTEVCAKSLEEAEVDETAGRQIIEEEEEDARELLHLAHSALRDTIQECQEKEDELAAKEDELVAASDVLRASNDRAASDLEEYEEEQRKQIEEEEEELLQMLQQMDDVGELLARHDEMLTEVCAKSLEEAEVDETAGRRIIEEEEEDARKLLHLAHSALKDTIQECQEKEDELAAKEDELVAASDVLRASNDRAVSDLEEYEEEQRKQIEDEEEELRLMFEQMDDVGELLARHDEMLTEVCTKSLEEAEFDETAARQTIEDEEEDARKLLHLAHSALRDVLQECQTKEDELVAASDALRASNDRAVSDLEEQEQEQRKQIEDEEDAMWEMFQQMDDVGELLARHDELLTEVCAKSLEEAEVDETAARQIIEDEEEDARKLLHLAHSALKDTIQECQEKEDELAAKEDELACASDALRASNDRAVSDLEEQEQDQRKQIGEEEEELLQMLQQMDDVGELLARHDEMLTEVCAKSLEEAEVDETAGRQIIEEEEEDARKLLHLAHSALKDTIQECQEKEDELAAKEDELACASDALRASNDRAVSDLEEQEQDQRKQIEEEEEELLQMLQQMDDVGELLARHDEMLTEVCAKSLEEAEVDETAGRQIIEEEEEDARELLHLAHSALRDTIQECQEKEDELAAKEDELVAASDVLRASNDRAASDLEEYEEEQRKQIEEEEEELLQMLQQMDDVGELLARHDEMLTEVCAKSLEEAEVDETAGRQIIEEEEEDARELLHLAHSALRDTIQECQEKEDELAAKEDELVAASDVLRASNDRAASDLEEYEEEQRKQIEEEEEELLQMLQQMDDVGELLARHDEMLTEVCAKSLEEAEVDETAGRQIIEEEEEDARELLHLAHSALRDTIQECQEKEDELAAKEDELVAASDVLRASNDRAASDLEEYEEEQRKQIEEEEEELLQMLQQMDEVGELLARHDEMLTEVCAKSLEEAEVDETAGRQIIEEEEEDARELLHLAHSALRDTIQECQEKEDELAAKEDELVAASDVLRASNDRAVSDLEEYEEEQRKQIEDEEEELRLMFEQMDDVGELLARHDEMLTEVCTKSLEEAEFDETAARQTIEDEEEDARKLLHLAHSALRDVLQECQTKEDELVAASDVLRASNDRAVSDLEEQEQEQRKQIEEEEEELLQMLQQMDDVGELLARHDEMLTEVCAKSLEEAEVDEAAARQIIEEEEEGARRVLREMRDHIGGALSECEGVMLQAFQEALSAIAPQEEQQRAACLEAEHDAWEQLQREAHQDLFRLECAALDDEQNVQRRATEAEEQQTRDALGSAHRHQRAVLSEVAAEETWRRHIEDDEAEAREMLRRFMQQEEEARDSLSSHNTAAGLLGVQEEEARQRDLIEEEANSFFGFEPLPDGTEAVAQKMKELLMQAMREADEQRAAREEEHRRALEAVEEEEALQRAAIEDEAMAFYDTTLPQHVLMVERAQNNADRAAIERAEAISRSLQDVEDDEAQRRCEIEEEASDVLSLFPQTAREVLEQLRHNQFLEKAAALESEAAKGASDVRGEQEDEAARLLDNFKKFASELQGPVLEAQQQEQAERAKIVDSEAAEWDDMRGKLWNDLLQGLVEEEEAEKLRHLLAVEDANETVAHSQSLAELARIEAKEAQARNQVAAEEARCALDIARQLEGATTAAVAREVVGVQRDEDNQRQQLKNEAETALNKLLTDSAEPCMRSAIRAEEERLAKQLHLINDTLNLFKSTANLVATKEREAVEKEEAAGRHETRSIEDVQWQNLMSAADDSRRNAQNVADGRTRGNLEDNEADARALLTATCERNRASLIDMFLSDVEDILRKEEERERAHIQRDERKGWDDMFDSVGRERDVIRKREADLAADIDELVRNEKTERDDLMDDIETQLAMLASDLEESAFTAQEQERDRRRREEEAERARKQEEEAERERRRRAAERLAAERRRRQTAYMGLEISEGIVVGRTKDYAGEKITRDGVPYDFEGVKVYDVAPQGPAYMAGIDQDDVVTHFNGEQVTTLLDFRTCSRKTKPGDKVRLTVYRPNAGICEVEIQSEIVDEEQFEPGSRRTLGYKVPVLARASYQQQED